MRPYSPRELARLLRARRRRRDRQEFHQRAAMFTAMLAVDAGPRGRFLVQSDDLHIGRSLFLAGERQEMPALERAVAVLTAAVGQEELHGSTIVDVGANIGTTTVPALLSGVFGHALAIEPEPENFDTLSLNLVLNDLEKRVVTVRAAASDFDGSEWLAVAAGRSGNHRLTGKRPTHSDGEIEVRTATVDGLLREEGIEPESVGLLWIDAEGSEDRVVTGASNVIERGTPLVLELSPAQVERAGGSQRALEETVARHYSHFVPVDLRGPQRRQARLQPTSELPSFAARVADRSFGKRKLDVLMLNLRDGAFDSAEVEKALYGD